MSNRILIVEDDPAMQMVLGDNLLAEGYEVLQATTCKQARELLSQHSIDLLLLDVMLPDGDGMSLCKSLREQGFANAIILLTALGEERDRVLGLDLGADDYLSKPFGLRELLARIRAQLRKHSTAPANANETVRVGESEVNLKGHSLSRAGESLEISSKEFELLRYLIQHRGEVVSRDELLTDVWGHKADVETRTVDNFIVRLRKKIELDHSKPKVLLTVHGSGYKLV
jgi:DNA-binding response OmpR family regulator